MSHNPQLWREKQSQAWTGRMQDHSKPAESSWILLAAGFSLSDKWTLVSVQVGSGIAAAPKTSPQIPLISQNLCCSCSQRGAQCISATVPQVWAPPNWVFNIQGQLSSEKSLFPSIMNCQWWHKVSPTGVMVQVGAVIAWNWTGAPWCHQGKELQQPWSSTCVGESKVSHRGGSKERVSPSSCFEEKEGRKEEPLLPFIFLLLPPSTLPSGKHPCQQLNSWDWGVISHTHTRKITSGSSTSPKGLLFEVTDFVPLPQWGSACTQLCQIVLFSRDSRQERKRSLLFSSLCIQGLPAWLLLFFQRGKDRIHCFCFSTGTIQLLFPMSQTPLMNTNTLSSQKDKDSKIHYLQEIGGSCYKFCAR